MIELSTIPLDVTDHIVKFRDFLKRAWPDFDNIMGSHDWDEDGDFIDDWMDVCWEFLVGRELLGKNNIVLTSFSTQFNQIEKTPTHTILAVPATPNALLDLQTKKNIPSGARLRLYCFLTSRDGFLGLYPPFDLIAVVDDATKKIYTTYFDQVRFILCEVNA